VCSHNELLFGGSTASATLGGGVEAEPCKGAAVNHEARVHGARLRATPGHPPGTPAAAAGPGYATAAAARALGCRHATQQHPRSLHMSTFKRMGTHQVRGIQADLRARVPPALPASPVTVGASGARHTGAPAVPGAARGLRWGARWARLGVVGWWVHPCMRATSRPCGAAVTPAAALLWGGVHGAGLASSPRHCAQATPSILTSPSDE